MIYVAILVIFLSICLTFYRVLKGPTIPDRISAADSIGLQFFAVIILLAYLFKADFFLDIAMVYAILLFVDILVMAKYLESKEGKE